MEVKVNTYVMIEIFLLSFYGNGIVILKRLFPGPTSDHLGRQFDFFSIILADVTIYDILQLIFY